MVGVSESATVNNIIVAIKLTVVIAFIVIGSRYVNPANWSPLVPAQIPAPPAGHAHGHVPPDRTRAVGRGHRQQPLAIRVGGVIHAAAVIFFAYLGFEAVSTAGAEITQPGPSDMPIGILGALVICTVLYIATSAVLVGIVPYASLDNPAPIATAVNQMGMPWFAYLVKIGAIAGLSSVMLVLLYGQTRIFYTMSRDGLLPASLALVHKRFKTPWINTIIVGDRRLRRGRFPVAGRPGRPLQRRLAGRLRPGLHHGDLSAGFQPGAGAAVPRRRSFPVVPILGAIMCLVLLMSLMAAAATRNFFLVYLASAS